VPCFASLSADSLPWMFACALTLAIRVGWVRRLSI
jgi:hypothetical protein